MSLAPSVPKPGRAALARPARLSEEVGRWLAQRIRAGELAPGARLPTEKQLAQELAVSRAVVREALSRLKAEGYVETRQGAGAFVAPRPGGTSFRLAEAAAVPALAEVFELRLMVEAGAAELAARRRSPQDLERLRTELARMEAALAAGEDRVAADDAFHRALAAASHNSLVDRFVEFLGGHLSESRLPTWSAAGQAAGRAKAAQGEHRRLFEAIAAGDAAAAKRAARTHLRNAAKRVGIVLE